MLASYNARRGALRAFASSGRGAERRLARSSSSSSSSASSPWSDLSHVKSVGVIGGGVAGLSAARALRARGLAVTVLEAAPSVGGVWRANYKGFGLQVPKQLYEFPDFPFAAVPAGEFPTGPQVQSYIEGFARFSGLDAPGVVRTSTRVERLERRAGGARGWTFHVARAGGERETLDFDFAVVASGMYSQEALPELPGREAFAGRVTHSRDFGEAAAAAAAGKNVVVLGSAKSAIDCALVAAAAPARSATLLFRNAHWGTPRKIAGIIPFQYVFLSRLGQALVSWYKGAWPTAPSSVKAAHAALAPVMGPVFGIVQALFAFQLGLRGALRPAMDVVKDFYGYAQVHDSSFKQAVASGSVALAHGRVERLEPGAVVARLADGAQRTIPCDVLVCGTGFTKRYDYLPAAERAALDAQPDGLWLYRHTLPPAVADLAFVGSEVATISNNVTHGLQAEWLARTIARAPGASPLPAPGAMRESIEAHKAWARAWMPDTPSRANLVLLHQVHFHDSLLRDIGVKHRRYGGLAEIFWPYEGQAYAGIIGK
jgi:cation diffusion facilitator CzcD-associated flavoprotein CzcO